MTRAGCVFCTVEGEKVPGRRPLPEWPHVTSHITRYASDALPTAGVMAVFEPLAPVTPGHLLVVPAKHVEHAAENPVLAAACMDVAATIAKRYKAANIITSIGAAATQTVRHLHVHVVPRHPNDGLVLPWTAQQKPHAAAQKAPQDPQGPRRPLTAADTSYDEPVPTSEQATIARDVVTSLATTRFTTPAVIRGAP